MIHAQRLELEFGWKQWTWQHILRIDVPPKPSIQHYHKKCGPIGGMMHLIWKILVAKLMHIFQIRKGIKYNLILCMFLGYFEVTKPYLLDVCQVQKIIKNQDVVFLERMNQVENVDDKACSKEVESVWMNLWMR